MTATLPSRIYLTEVKNQYNPKTVKTEKIEEHQIHSEWAEVPQKTLEAIVETKKRGGRVIAVGTTTARTLEFFCDKFQIPNSKFQINSKLKNLKIAD